MGASRRGSGSHLTGLPDLSGVLFAAIVCVLLSVVTLPAQAQTSADSAAVSPTARLLSRLATQRFERHAHRLIAASGERPSLMPLDTFPVWDSMMALLRPTDLAADADTIPPVPSFVVWDVQVVRKLARSWFEEQFVGTQWAYLGSERITPLDTTRTWRLRAALESAHGRPTETIIEKGLEAREKGEALNVSTSLQFGYWFVVNGSIPVVVTDVSGPLDRGLVMASDAHLGEQQLRGLRATLLEPLAQAARDASGLAEHVDLFYDAEAGRWYQAGFDGTRFRIEPISTPNLRLGRPYRFTD